VAGVSGWLAERRAPRIALIAGLFVLPFVFVFSVAIVGFTAQLRGWRAAAADCLPALVIVSLVTMAAGDNWVVLSGSAVILWSLAAASGALVGRCRSLDLPLQVLILVGMLGVLAFSMVIGDAQAFWERVIGEQIAAAVELGFHIEQPELLIDQAGVMTGSLAASTIFFLVLALLLSGWWAGSAGGRSLGRMFVSLRLGYVIGSIATVSGLVSLLGPGSLAINLLLVAAVGFLFQGLAVVYWQGVTRRWPQPWPVALYLPLVLGPEITAGWMFALVALGFVDNWYGLRRGPQAG